MDTMKTLEELAQLMEKYGLSEISVEEGDFKAAMSKLPSMPVMAAPVPQMAAAAPSATPAQASPAMTGNIIKSPIIGTFYAAPAPGKAPFAAVGQQISQGDVVCIVESMKLMNEINSEFSGKVVEIFVKDGEAVEFDQPLMRIE